MSMSVADLITAVKRRASVPDNQDRYSDDDFVAIAQEELNQTIFPMVFSLMEEFFVVKTSVELQTDGVNNYPSLLIPIPSRAYARTVRELQYVETDGVTRYNIPQTALDDIDVLPNVRSLKGFYFLNDCIKLVGDADTLTGTLEIHFVVRPTTLVNSDVYALISNLAYSGGTTTFTVSSVSTDMNTYCASSATKLFDVYRASTGAIVKTDVALERSVLNFTTTDLTEDDVTDLATYQPGGYSVAAPYTSDLYLVPAGQCPYTPIPPEADQALILAVAGRILEGIGDTSGLAVNDNRLDKTTQNLAETMGARIQGESKVVTNRRGIRSAFRNF